MSRIGQVEQLKIRILDLVDDSQDSLLEQLLQDAEEAILNYLNRDQLEGRHAVAVRNLALVYYNRIGDEGVASSSQGGISTSYITDIPEDIKKQLPTPKLRMCHYANQKP